MERRLSRRSSVLLECDSSTFARLPPRSFRSLRGEHTTGGAAAPAAALTASLVSSTCSPSVEHQKQPILRSCGSLCGETMTGSLHTRATAASATVVLSPCLPSVGHETQHFLRSHSSLRGELLTGGLTPPTATLASSLCPTRGEHETQHALQPRVSLCGETYTGGLATSTTAPSGALASSLGSPTVESLIHCVPQSHGSLCGETSVEGKTLSSHHPPSLPRGAGDIGWSFGSHTGETAADGTSIWPGAVPAPVATQACRRRSSDSGGSGWNHSVARARANLPVAIAPTPGGDRLLGQRRPSYCEILDGTLSAGWFSDSVRGQWLAAGRDNNGLTPRLLVPAKPLRWLHDEVLPLPDLHTILRIEKECRSRPPDVFGPLGKRWLQRVDKWSRVMKTKYQNNRKAVAGSWRLSIDEWEKRLQRVSKARRQRVLRIIKFGVTHPFKTDAPPPKPIRKLSNHPRLHERPDAVWETLSEQLNESAIDPHDCGAFVAPDAPAGTLPVGVSDVDVLPKGIYPIRWVSKTSSDRVRITINMIPFNKHLAKDSGAVDLATLSKIASLWQKGDDQVTLDQHSAYYHLEYSAAARDWVGFMVDDTELPPAAVQELARRCPHARWGKSKWVFTYRGLAMGCKPSAAQYCSCVDTLMDTWRNCTVGRAVGLPVEQVRCSQYIDDSIYMVQGFAHAMELSLRVTLEHIICGFHINVTKSHLLPHFKRQFLGCWCDSSDLSFSLTPKRCVKLRSRLSALREEVTRVAKARGKQRRRVAMRTVAQVVGSIWSIHIVCHKAVAILARSMIAVLASELRHDWLRKERDMFRLKRLLRGVWGRTAKWSASADEELRFWQSIEFEKLKSPMGFDALFTDAKAAIMRPATNVLGRGVKVFCSDSSNHSTGAAEFVPNDGDWLPVDTMFVRLSDRAVTESSAYAELEGVLKTDLTLLPSDCKHVFFVCDNEAVTIILQRGSRHPLLQHMAAAIFRKCLRIGRILHPVWRPRTDKIVRIADLGGRIIDQFDFHLPMHLFWKANSIARSLWGRGFQYDRFSSFNTVMPADCRRKLPFNSYYMQPYSSGRCAFIQRWRNWVNWVHPPHHLIARVIGLLKRQHAVAAVVLPMGARALWSSTAVQGAEGVARVFTYNPRSARNRLVGKSHPTQWRGLFAIVFFDFRLRRGPFARSPSAEHFAADDAAEGHRYHDQLLFCMAPGLFPSSSVHSTDRFARCDATLIR